MTARSITTDSLLRELLRTARRHARLSQKKAAEKSGVSPAWWKRVESAYEVSVSVDTLTDMLDAVGVLPGHLDGIGQQDLAARLARHQSFRSTAAAPAGLEEYLMAAPAPDDLRHELVTYVRARQVLRLRPAEPFADQFYPRPGPAAWPFADHGSDSDSSGGKR